MFSSPVNRTGDQHSARWQKRKNFFLKILLDRRKLRAEAQLEEKIFSQLPDYCRFIPPQSIDFKTTP
jgi:hypothetical protein